MKRLPLSKVFYRGIVDGIVSKSSNRCNGATLEFRPKARFTVIPLDTLCKSRLALPEAHLWVFEDC